MKKYIKTKYRILAALLAIIIFTITLASCGDTGSGEEATTADATAEQATAEDITTTGTTASETINDTTTAGTTVEETSAEETTEPDEKKTMLDIYKDGMWKYTLDVSTDVSAQNDADILYLRSVLSEKYGSAIPDGTGSNSIHIAYGGEKFDWLVSASADSGITITGGCVEAMKKAVYAFLSGFCATSSGKSLSVEDGDSITYKYAEDRIDNSGYLSYIPTESVEMTPSNSAGTLMTPEWVDSLVMVEVRPDTASLGGSLADSYKLIDFYAEAGVNGIWLAPIYQRGIGGNGYGNYGPHTVDPVFTGTDDFDEGWQKVREFVDYAHLKGIYVFLDIITWGVMRNAPLITEHPDWFSGEAWGNAAFNWNNQEFVDWFTAVCVDNIMTTGADGLRCDCEPNYSGYKVYENVRNQLSALGKHIIIISEDGNTRRNTYDFEQDGVIDYSSMSRADYYFKPVSTFVDGYLDIVSSVKTGKGIGIAYGQSNPATAGSAQYYTNCLTNHDFVGRIIKGNRLNIGYQAIYAPYIPIWYMGDEFNATNPVGTLYEYHVDYSEAGDDDNLFFFEDVKKMISIRREYRDIFEYWPLNHKTTNICAVTADGLDSLTSYARFAGNQAVLVIPNNNAKSTGVGTVHIPVDKAGLSGYTEFTVTDLLTGRVVYEGSETSFGVIIPCDYMGVYLVNGS